MTGQSRRSSQATGRKVASENLTSIEVEAKTPESAIEQALEKLSISRDQAEVEVLDEGKSGFMGIGSKKARVRVSVKSAHEGVAGDLAQRSLGDVPGAGPPSGEGPPASGEGAFAEGKAGVSGPVPSVEAALREILPCLLASLDPKATVKTIRLRDGRYECELDVAAENMAVVLGRRGRTLDAIQTLAAALASRRCDSHVRVVLDCGGFRAKRREVLVQMAQDAAAEALSSGDEIHLEPMSAHDRKIVHATLSTHNDVETISEDVGDYRHVVVRVKRAVGSGRHRPGAPREDRNGGPGGRGGRAGRGGGRPESRGGRGDGRFAEHQGGDGQRSGSGGPGAGRRARRGFLRDRSDSQGAYGSAGGGRPFEERDGNRAEDYMPDESIPDDIGNRAD